MINQLSLLPAIAPAQQIALINQAKRAIANGSDPKDTWYIITQVWQLSDDADYAEGLELWEKLKPCILDEAIGS